MTSRSRVRKLEDKLMPSDLPTVYIIETKPNESVAEACRRLGHKPKDRDVVISSPM